MWTARRGMGRRRRAKAATDTRCRQMSAERERARRRDCLARAGQQKRAGRCHVIGRQQRPPAIGTCLFTNDAVAKSQKKRAVCLNWSVGLGQIFNREQPRWSWPASLSRGAPRGKQKRTLRAKKRTISFYLSPTDRAHQRRRLTLPPPIAARLECTPSIRRLQCAAPPWPPSSC